MIWNTPSRALQRPPGRSPERPPGRPPERHREPERPHRRPLHVLGGSLAALVAVAALACNYAYDPPPTSAGEFGVGTFIYRCAGDSDALCPNNVYATAFPSAIAIGGRFSLDYEFDKEHDDLPLPALESGAPERVSQSGEVFRALLPGYTAILAVSANSEVVDVKHMLVSPIDHLLVTVDGLSTTGSIEIEAGQVVELIAAPQDANDVALGGSLEYTWELADPSLGEWLTGTDDETVSLGGLAEGTTTLIIHAADHMMELPLTVTPGASTSTSTGESTTTTDSTTTDATTTDGSTTDGTTTDATTTDGTTTDGTTTGG